MDIVANMARPWVFGDELGLKGFQNAMSNALIYYAKADVLDMEELEAVWNGTPPKSPLRRIAAFEIAHLLEKNIQTWEDFKSLQNEDGFAEEMYDAGRAHCQRKNNQAPKWYEELRFVK